MKSSQLIQKAQSVATSATVSYKMDMTNFKGCAVQLNKTLTGTASAKCEWSLDGVTWEAVAAGNGGATKVVAAGTQSYFWNLTDIYQGQVRLLIDTVAIATVPHEVFMHAKAY